MHVNRTNREARAAVIRDLDEKIRQIMERGSHHRRPATDEDAQSAVEGRVADEFVWEVFEDA
jgi:hypothetical protein